MKILASKKMEVEVLPCPFCRKSNLEVKYYNCIYTGCYAIHCKNGKCGATGPYGSDEADAVELWNDRK